MERYVTRRTTIDRSLEPLNRFFHNENAGGVVLFLSVAIAIICANSPLRAAYHHLWEMKFSISLSEASLSHSLHQWVNDGLMAVFFFVVGLELKREFIAGELSSFRKAVLPMAAALGGMLAPALIYLLINRGLPSEAGWGIPMATDIVFALALLTLGGKKIPLSAKVFLVALATVDDLGAVVVIAFFYSSDLSLVSLGIGLGLFTVLIAANYIGVRNTIFYSLIGIAGVWLAFLLSGVHATIAGVLVAFAIPARTHIDEKGYSKRINLFIAEFDKEIPKEGTLLTQNQHRIISSIKKVSSEATTPLQQIEDVLHPWVKFLVIPLFALSNAGVEIGSDFFADVVNPISIGIFGGLVLGKIVGILSFTWILVKLNVATLPHEITWKHVMALGLLAGVGFTMSLFISGLAFSDPHMIDQSKYGILLASLLSGILGVLILRAIGRH